VVDSTSLSNTATVSISVSTPGNAPPTASITATPRNGPSPLTVSFDGSASSDSDGSIVSYDWDFADSSSHGSGATASHEFASDGTYNVVLTVTDDGSTPLTGTAVVTITVGGVANRPPDISSATATPWYGPAPLTVNFDATGVRDLDGDAVSVSWDFGDSSAPSSDRSVSHVYASNGVYTAVLTAQDDQQPPNVSSTSFHIAVTDNEPPDLEAAVVTPLSGVFPLTVTFDATGCTDPDGDHITYRWEVAVETTESLTSASPTMQHTFPDPGDYDATLTLTDDGDPPLEVSKHFLIDVQYPPESGQPERVTLLKNGCACVSSGPPALQLAAGAVLIATLVVARRRRRS
jgi:MYXO-CTERM domain-containing protein